MLKSSHTYTSDCPKCDNDEPNYDTVLCKMTYAHAKRNIDTNKINLSNFTPIVDMKQKCAKCNISNIYYLYKTNDGIFTINKIICSPCYNAIKTCAKL